MGRFRSPVLAWRRGNKGKGSEKGSCKGYDGSGSRTINTEYKAVGQGGTSRQRDGAAESSSRDFFTITRGPGEVPSTSIRGFRVVVIWKVCGPWYPFSGPSSSPPLRMQPSPSDWTDWESDVSLHGTRSWSKRGGRTSPVTKTMALSR